jgi:cytochrome c-type biogenesis protein CcmH/NrfG
VVRFDCRTLSRGLGWRRNLIRCLVVAFACAIAGCALRRPAATGRSETTERLSEQARQARERGDRREAESLLAAAVERNPGDDEMRLELAELQLENGSPENAADHLQKLIRRNPDDPRPCVGLAEARYQQQKLGEADQLVDRALELDPRQIRAHLLRGKIEQAQGNNRRAVEDYYQVLAFEPDHIEAKMLLAELHFQQGDARHAAPLLRSIIETAEATNPQRGRAQWLLGECYARDGRWSDAARALGAGIASRRASHRDWYELADACRRSGDIRDAEQALAQALRLAPGDPQLLALRAALDEQNRSAGFRGGPVVTSLSHESPAPAQPPVRETP